MACIEMIIPEEYVTFYSLAFMGSIIVFGVISLIMLIKNKAFSSVTDVPSTMSKSKRTIKLIFAPATVILLVFMFIYSMLFFNAA